MPAALVVNPVVVQGSGRTPYVATIDDPGRSGKNLLHVSAVGAGGAALSFVYGRDLSLLNDDPLVKFVFEGSYPSGAILVMLEQSPLRLGWTSEQQVRLTNSLAENGASTVGISNSTPLAVTINRLGQIFSPGWNAREINFNFREV